MRLEADFLKAGVDDRREYHDQLHPNGPEPDPSLLRGRALQSPHDRTATLRALRSPPRSSSAPSTQISDGMPQAGSPTGRPTAASYPNGSPRPGRPPHVRDHSSPREPFYHPAGDPRIQHNEFQEPSRIPPSQEKSTTSDPPGRKHLRRQSRLTPRRSQGNQPRERRANSEKNHPPPDKP